MARNMTLVSEVVMDTVPVVRAMLVITDHEESGVPASTRRFTPARVAMERSVLDEST